MNQAVSDSTPLGLNKESMQFIEEHPKTFKRLKEYPVMHDVLQYQDAFDLWLQMCWLDNQGIAVHNRISAEHFTPAMLKYYMQRQVRRQNLGEERNISRHGVYHLAGRSLIYPGPELIDLCSKNAIVITPCYTDKETLQFVRKSLRPASMKHFDHFWETFGLPLKKTSSLPLASMRNTSSGEAGKLTVKRVNDDFERITLMLYFAKMFGNDNVRAGPKNSLSREDEQKVSELDAQEEKLAKPVPIKLSKADMKMMKRSRKKKKRGRKGKAPARSNQRDMNRKFELLRLKRKMGLEKTIV